MIRSIIVPLDGSAFAEQAIPWATAIAARSGARLTVVHVHVPVIAEEGVPYTVTDKRWNVEARESEREYLTEWEERLRSDGVEAESRLVDGTVVSALSDLVEETGADVVVMATHGRGGLSRAWLGSIADGFIRHSPAPVLLVRPGDAPAEAPPEIRSILVPLDGSDLAEQILTPALQFAELFGAECTLLRVVTQTYVPGQPYVARAIDPERLLREEREGEAEQYLAEVIGRLERESVPIRAATIAAPAADGILRWAEREPVDLIAIATHGRGAALRLLLGGVADKVIRGADVPVLVYRPGAG